MGTYYIVFIILYCSDTLFGYIYKDKMTQKKQNTSFCIVAFIALFLLFALRHQSMGHDLGYLSKKMGYLESFDILNTYSWKDIILMKNWLNYEKGFIIFNKLVGTIINNRQFFLGSCAFVSLLPVMLYISKKSSLPFLSVVIYMGLPVFLMQYSGLRQNIAIAITVLSMKFVEEKKIVYFVLTILLATLFHKTAIIFLVAYPMYHIGLNDIWKAVFTLIIPVVYLLRKPLFNTLSKMFKDEATVRDTGALTLFLIFIALYIYLIIDYYF